MNLKFVFLLFLSSVISTSPIVAKQPNVIFIYTDDQAPFAVNAAGDHRFITPNIDKIFHGGAHLTNSFVTTPVCSPSRAGLIASRYSFELGITDWINPGAEKQLGLPADTVTFPQLFQTAGYQTALFGKWHLGIQDRHHPTKFGYHQFAGIRTGGCPPKDPVMETLEGETKKVLGYTCDIFTDHALGFIRSNKNEPFLLSLHFRAPHSAWLPVRPEDWEPFKDLDPEIPNPDFPDLDVALVKKRTREYLAAVKSVDRNVGRVLDVLDTLKLTSNTIVVFTSDHGYNLGEHGTWFKGNAIRILKKNPPKQWDDIPAKRRPNLWDTSLRVPTAIRWPGTIVPGTVHDQTFSNLDWFPTLLAMAGIKPARKLQLRGEDFTPVLIGKTRHWDPDIYLQYSMKHGAITHMRGVRTPGWKLMIDLQHQGRVEMYDLQQDPHERLNLATSDSTDHKDQLKRLKQMIKNHMESVGDPLLKMFP